MLIIKKEYETFDSLLCTCLFFAVCCIIRNLYEYENLARIMLIFGRVLGDVCMHTHIW